MPLTFAAQCRVWSHLGIREEEQPSMKTLIALLLCAAGLYGATLKAGLAKVDITPSGPVWMSGYALRAHPSEGVLSRLWAKALALESSPGGRIVMVSTDLVGI